MSNNIFEESPEQKPAAAAGAKAQLEKQARQLAYDTKYKVKQSLGKQTKLNPAQVSKAYLTQLAKSTAAPAVKALAKKKLMGEEYLQDIDTLVEKTITNVLNKVFVEGVDTQQVEVEEEVGEKQYKIRVTDKKSGNTYVRNATRSKIAELRANPNISSVEMTSYGEVSKDEREKGSKTAAAKAGKDYDGDGKIESGAKEYRGAVHNAIQRKKGLKPDGKDTSSVKEEIIYEKEDKEPKVEGLKKGKKNKVKIFPEVSEQVATQRSSAQDPKKSIDDSKKKQETQSLDRMRQQEVQILQKKLQALRSAPRGTDPSITASYQPEGENIKEVAPPSAKSERMVKHIKKSYAKDGKLTDKEKSIAYATAWKHYKEACECQDQRKMESDKAETPMDDVRSLPTKMNMAKNKMRAMGLKMSYEPEGKAIEEAKQSFPMKKVEKQMAKARSGSVYAKKGNPAVPNTTDSEKKETTRFSKMHHASEKAKREKQEADKARRSSTFYKDTHPASAPKMKKANEEVELIDERRKEDKVAGTPRKPRNPAFEIVAKAMGAGRMGVQPRGKKKEPGKKPPTAGQYGAPASPAQKVAKRRADAQRAKDNMSSRFD